MRRPLNIPKNIPIRALHLERRLAADAGNLLNALGLGKRLAVVSDANTHHVLGMNLERQLPGCLSIQLPDGVKPTLEVAEKLQQQIITCDAAVAVGSGTINDLCKYASFRAGKPYAVFGTAPSMNGYSSANASLIVEGYRTSRAAHLPAGIFLDLDILADAPLKLIQSGLGDALCRPTAQADWLLSHLLLGTPYRQDVFELLLPYEATLFDNAEGLLRRDISTIEALASSLVLSGIGMTLCGGSYPASQGEHMIAHTMEMLHGATLPETFHGQEIGVTTLTMARLQERVILSEAKDLAQRKILRSAQDDITAYFGDLAATCTDAYSKKLALMKNINEKLSTDWLSIREKIRAVTLPVSRLQKILASTGAPTTPADLGWPEELYLQAVLHAKYSRERFTFLDLV